MKKFMLLAAVVVVAGLAVGIGEGRDANADEGVIPPRPPVPAPAPAPGPGPGSLPGSIRAGTFPVLGAEYVLDSHRPVLPPGACYCNRVVVLEHGRESWYLVGFNAPGLVSWKGPEFHVIWLNLDHVITMDEVAEEARLIHVPKG